MLYELLSWVPLLVFVATSIGLYLKYREEKQARKKSRYVDDALSNLDEVTQGIKNICDMEDPERDFFFDCETIADDLLRAAFDLRTHKLTLRFNTERASFRTIGKERAREDEKLDAVRLKTLLEESETLFYVETNCTIDGWERTVGNSPTFADAFWIKDDLRKIHDKLSLFKNLYESFEPKLFECVEKEREAIDRLLAKYIAFDRVLSLDLMSFAKSTDIEEYLANELAGDAELRSIAQRIKSQLPAYINNVRKELFKIRFQGQ